MNARQTVDERWADRLEQLFEQAGGEEPRAPRLEIVSPVVKDSLPPLSARELEVLRLIADGKTYKEIGLITGLSAKTVDCYAQRIKLKTRVNSLALLIRFAIKEGYVNA